MCDYSLHAVASRPARLGDILVTTVFRGTWTRGFAAADAPDIAVCMLPGTELAFASAVTHDGSWIYPCTIDSAVGKFNQVDRDQRHRHHDVIEFPDGSSVHVTRLRPGQRVTVLQLPVTAVPPAVADAAQVHRLGARAQSLQFGA